MIIIAVASAKGGSTRTTSAMFLAQVLHEKDQRVLLVDADPQGCALAWRRHTGLPFPVIGLNSERLHEDLSTATADRYDAVVIDTPPLGAVFEGLSCGDERRGDASLGGFVEGAEGGVEESGEAAPLADD